MKFSLGIIVFLMPCCTHSICTIYNDRSIPSNADYRLPGHFSPITYKLSFEIYQSARLNKGHVTITAHALVDTKEVTLHAHPLFVHITSAVITTSKCRQDFQQPDFTSINNRTATFLMSAACEISKGQYVVLKFRFTWLVSLDLGFGAHRWAPYNQKKNETQIEIITQFEMTGARRMFPCFDEPEWKAKFNLRTLQLYHTDAKSIVALFNTPGTLVERSMHYAKWTFQKMTPVMSTYLVALVIGKFPVVLTAPKSSNSPEVSIFMDHRTLLAPPLSRNPNQNKDYRQFVLDAIEYFEEYFDFKTPVEKFDFAHVGKNVGGMENWGLIVLDKLHTSIETLVHEVVHQWFGNIVTCRWWDDLWLNEALTSFYTEEYLMKIKPELYVGYKRGRLNLTLAEQVQKRRADKLFQSMNTMNKLPARDRSLKTEDFYRRKTRHLLSWRSLYVKGPFVVAMLQDVISEKAIRQAVKVYLKKHQYSSATTADFLQCLQEQVDKYGVEGWDKDTKLNVTQLLTPWLLDERHPLVTIYWNETLKVYSFNTEPNDRWIVPIWLGDKRNQSSNLFWVQPNQTLYLSSDNGVPDDPQYLAINPDKTGYYKTLLHEPTPNMWTEWFKMFLVGS